jgi:superfamily II DNA or RNA helicase
VSSLALFPADAPPAPLPLDLRPYQEKGVQAIREAIAKGAKRVLAVAPTGAGKTRILASIIQTSRIPVLFVCDSMEILDQLVAQLARAGITNVGVIRGSDTRVDPTAAIQIATIQSLSRREKPFAGKRVLILVDEAHISASDSWKKNIFDAYPDAFIVGFTATPTRLDGKPLGALYHVLVEIVRYSEILKHPEWLVTPDVYGAPVRPDLSGVHKVRGDFNEGELGEAMSEKKLVGHVVKHWGELAHLHPRFAACQVPGGKAGHTKTLRISGVMDPGEPRRTVLFAVTIAHSRALCEEFSRERPDVRIEHLDGTTPERTRRAMLADLAEGRIQIVSNVGVMVKGLDIPALKCVIHARPTESLVLWMQTAGRCLRPWNGVVPLILDHAGNYERHGAPHEDRRWSLEKAAERGGGVESRTKACKKCHAFVPVTAYACAMCGAPFPMPKEKPPAALPEQVDRALEKKSEGSPRRKGFASPPDDEKRAAYNALVSKARTFGFRPGFASVKYKESYGAWPPGAWTGEARAQFEADKIWQAALARREDRKRQESDAEARDRAAFEAKFETEKARRARLTSTEPGAAPEREPESDDELEDFSSWLRTQGI